MHIGVHQTAGGVHVAVQNFAQRGDAVRAGEANPHRRINLIRKGGVGAVFEECRFKAGGRVEHNDNTLERAVGDSGQQINFVLVKLQIVAVQRHSALTVALIAGQVKALAANAGDNDQRRVRIIRIAVPHRVGVLALGRFSGCNLLIVTVVKVAGVRGAHRAGLAAFIEVLQRRIGDEARVVQALIQVLVIARIEAARTGAAIF